VWQQVSRIGSGSSSFVDVLGSLTRYSIVPELAHEDEVESIILMASNSNNSTTELLVFPTFLYLLELFAETTDESKLARACGLRLQSPTGTGGKLTSTLNLLARNILRRRAFRFMRMPDSYYAGAGDWITVFDEEELAKGGLSDVDVLWWLRQAAAISLPHVQVPAILSFLESYALTNSEYALLDAGSSTRLWKASEIDAVLYAVVSNFSLVSECPPLVFGSTSNREERHMQRVSQLALRFAPLFFAEPVPAERLDESGVIAENHQSSLQCLYSSHNAPLLRDTSDEISQSLTAVWSQLRPAEGLADDAAAENAEQTLGFAARYSTLHVKIYTVLEFFLETQLIPAVLRADDVFALCSAVTGEEPNTFSEDSVVSQARLFEVLYLIAHNFWSTLENLRRKRPAGSSAIRLSTKQPQRAQQVLQTFLYLLKFSFSPPPETQSKARSPDLDARVATLSEDGAANSAVATALSLHALQPHQIPVIEPQPYYRPSGIPVPVPGVAPQHVPGSSSSAVSAHGDGTTRLSASALAVSFNSNKLASHASAAQGHVHDSFFSNHPLRDIAVLLVHFPVSSFQLSPWAVLQLLSDTPGGVAASPSRKGIANLSNPESDTLLTDLLIRFCKIYDVSSDRLTEFFALYYLTDSETLPITNSPDKSNLSFTLFKEKALRNKVMDFIMDEQALRLLIHNADLLKWEYARCVSFFRVSSDPFTEGIAVPLLTSDFVSLQPTASLLPRANALKWAAEVAHVSKERAEAHLGELSCLAGSSTPVLSLTFSSFVVFAIRCFADPILSAATPCSEVDFVSAVRAMLQSFSHSLSHVQQTLRMKVLKPLFGGSKDYAKEPLGEHDMAAILSASLKLFNNHSAIAPPAPSATSGAQKAAVPGDGRIPPRPPAIFWDAPRFAQFCRDTGVLAKCRWSVSICWTAFGYFMREQAAPGVELWDTAIVSPVPVKSTLEATRLLIESALATAELQGESVHAVQDFIGTVGIYYKTLVPVICVQAAGEDEAVKSPPKLSAAVEHLKLEDLLRYGGSAMAQSLSESQTFLRDAYLTLLSKAASALQDGTGSALARLLGAGGKETPAGLSALERHAEVPLNLLCAFFACENLLRMSSVAVQAKRSLHARLRPPYYSRSGAGPNAANNHHAEVVTLSYVEFEELFVRSAFLLWETSTAQIHPSNLANKAALVGQLHLPSKGSTDIDPETTAAAELYCKACSERSAELKRQKAASSEKRSSWGVDFLLLFTTVLRGITEISPSVHSYVALAEKNSAHSDSALLEKPMREKKPKGHVRFSNEVMVSTLRDEGNLSDIFTSRLNYSVADPAVRRGEVLSTVPQVLGPVQATAGVAAPLMQDHPLPRGHRRLSSGGSVGGSPPTGLLDRRQRPSHSSLEVSTNEYDRELGAREASPSPKLQTSQQIISSSSERFLLMQESTEQFVVALDTLLVGTKEALWPVYATYCSCGDSLDPGKLSGPNLFTLLSKLGVLTDRTLLSDVGVLLHQTAVHSLSSTPLDAIATLLASGDYYESPSLTFEEFIVFLCAFSQLRFEGVMLTPEMFNRQMAQAHHNAHGQGGGHRSSQQIMSSSNPENWFKQWQEYMGSSTSFRRLLVECVLPILQKQMLLAFPEDARLRDRFGFVFSLEVLLAIEGVEGPLLSFFEHERSSKAGLLVDDSRRSGARAPSPLTVSAKDEVEISAIVTALKRINLIPRVMEESQVLQLIKDVLPEGASRRRAASSSSSSGSAASNQKDYLLFPQWEWVLSVVAFQAVETAMQQSASKTDPKVRSTFYKPSFADTNSSLLNCTQKIPAMVADVIASIATAITQIV